MDNQVEFPSHLLQNSFISTLDHLPCDIVRSLWLIQSCNLKIENSKQEINDILSQYDKSTTITPESLVRIYELKKIIKHLSNESIQEARAMNNQLVTHKLNLLLEMSQLNKIEVFKNNKEQMDESHKKELREQLMKHYLENPLASQVEAVEEQKKENETKKPPEKKTTPFKMILKIPKQDKIVKPADKKIVKKIEKEPKVVNKKEINRAAAPKTKIKIKLDETETEPEDEEQDVEDNTLYCFCHQPSFGNMISCDNEDSCPNGEWFHYKCVGLLNRVAALQYTTGKLKWYCSENCKAVGDVKSLQDREKKRKKRRRKW